MPNSDLPTDEDLDYLRSENEQKREMLALLKAEETENLYGSQRLIDGAALLNESKTLDQQIAEMQARVEASNKPPVTGPFEPAEVSEEVVPEPIAPPEKPPVGTEKLVTTEAPQKPNGDPKADEKKGSQ